MGPVIGLAYGSTIRDFKLVRKSLYVEVISIGSCILIGAVVGLITGPTKLSEEWPTQQMKDRGSMTNFLVALPIAFFSGLGVAVSLLDDQTSSLVGVAISASLLPPAVNAGILWVAYLFAENDIIPVDNFNSVNDNDDSPTRHEYRKMGFLSLELTLANVGLIWISSMLMFRLKEVLPIKKKVRSFCWDDYSLCRLLCLKSAFFTHRTSRHVQIFWEDLGVARKIYQRKAYLENVDELSEELSAEEGEENRESPRT